MSDQTPQFASFDPSTLSHFRMWCINVWFEHLMERESFKLTTDYDSKEYFRKNKYFLKRMYKQEQTVIRAHSSVG